MLALRNLEDSGLTPHTGSAGRLAGYSGTASKVCDIFISRFIAVATARSALGSMGISHIEEWEKTGGSGLYINLIS